MIGDFYNGFEGFLRQMLLKLLEPFPTSEGIFWFLNDEVDLELLLEPLCLRNQLLAKSFTTEILYFDFWFLIFWDLFCTALSSNIVFWQTKTPNWVVMAWGECFVVHDRGTRLRCRTEVQDWNLRDVLPCKLPSVTSARVDMKQSCVNNLQVVKFII